MREPSLRKSRLAIAAGLAAAIAMGAAGFILGRSTTPRPEPQPAPIAAPKLPAIVKVEEPQILERADIIKLANRAADALASGAPLPEDVAKAKGRRVELVLPFGCGGPAPVDSSSPLQWRYDAERGTLRIHAAPEVWEPDDWGFAKQTEMASAIEGFWVTSPWSSADQCPESIGPGRSEVEPATLPERTLAIAQFTSGESKSDLSREGRSFDVVLRMAPDRLNAAQGFRLRLFGRLGETPDGDPVKCIQPAGSDQRPICVVAVSLVEIRMEQPLRSDPLAIWSLPSKIEGD